VCRATAELRREGRQQQQVKGRVDFQSTPHKKSPKTDVLPLLVFGIEQPRNQEPAQYEKEVNANPPDPGGERPNLRVRRHHQQNRHTSENVQSFIAH
jgi:hypothetical protein